MKVLDHPSFSPDLSPCDLQVFAPLKIAPRDRRLGSDEDIDGIVVSAAAQGVVYGGMQ
jgi:hypothetical protein